MVILDIIKSDVAETNVIISCSFDSYSFYNICKSAELSKAHIYIYKTLRYGSNQGPAVFSVAKWQ
jgi:hypothetical protein